MSTRQLCLEQLRAVREVGNGADAAYVARSRIGRLVVSCMRLVSEQLGNSSPQMPGEICVSPDASKFVQQIAKQSNLVFRLAKSLCQPSEPLDRRWRDDWKEMQSHLTELETALLSSMEFHGES